MVQESNKYVPPTSKIKSMAYGANVTHGPGLMHGRSMVYGADMVFSTSCGRNRT